MKPTLLLIFLCAIVAVYCAADPPAQPQKKLFGAELAKDALVRFVRANRNTFVFDVDPDKLAKVPIQSFGGDRYGIDPFTVDITKHQYSAQTHPEGLEPHFYSGDFVEHEGVWTAAAPRLQRFHRLPKKLK